MDLYHDRDKRINRSIHVIHIFSILAHTDYCFRVARNIISGVKASNNDLLELLSSFSVYSFYCMLHPFLISIVIDSYCSTVELNWLCAGNILSKESNKNIFNVAKRVTYPEFTATKGGILVQTIFLYNFDYNIPKVAVVIVIHHESRNLGRLRD